MDLGLSGRTAIVTGASAGMGLAVAEALAAEGANVVMLGRRGDLLAEHAARIGALAVPGDITRAEDLDRLVATTVEKHGGVDVVVLNGGGPPGSAATAVTTEALEAAVALALTPFVSLATRCLPYLRASGRGRIVAIESIGVKEPVAGLALSNAVRPGVVGWLKTLASEVAADGVTVNTIAPGRIETDRLRSLYGPDWPTPADLATIPMGRLGSPAEIAAVACFLASEAAAYVTGTVVLVDGGLARGIS
jgi:3-oxoacyl-[acyl-carrier protein] reductase